MSQDMPAEPKRKRKRPPSRNPEAYRASTQRYLERIRAQAAFEPVPFAEETRVILHGPRRGEVFTVLARQHSNEAA